MCSEKKPFNMDQDIVMQARLAGRSEGQPQEPFNIGFAQLKNVSYTTTHQPQGYSPAHLVSMLNMNPSHRAPIQPALDGTGCAVLGTHSGFVMEQALASQCSSHQSSRNVTSSVSDIHSYSTPIVLPNTPIVVNRANMAVVNEGVNIVPIRENYTETNGSTVAGPGDSVPTATADRNPVAGLTGDTVVNLLSSLRMALSPASSSSANKGVSSNFPPSDVPDGLCNMQLLTYSVSEGVRSVKLVTVTDVITMSLQFKCRLCEKAFTSPETLTAHSKTHASEREVQGIVTEEPSQNSTSQIKALVDSMIVRALKTVKSDAASEVKSNEEGEITIEMMSTDANGLQDDLQQLSGKQRVCHICNKTFDANELWKHFSDTHMGNKDAQCFVCGKMLQNDRELLRHMMTFHTGLKEETVFHCAVCDKQFPARPFLLNHMLQVHPAKDANSLVEKPSSKSPIKHSSSTDKVVKMTCSSCEGAGVVSTGKHTCRICKGLFSDSRLLQKHMSEHCEQTICAVCHKVVFLKSLPKHMMLHTKPKTWQCPQCDRAYRDKCDLTKHMRIHTGEKPYTCEICNKSFAHSSQLPRHLRTHSGEKPYECLVCHKVFSRKFGLQQHMGSHSDGKSFKCDQCGKEFRDRKGLKKHSLKHNSEHQEQEGVVGTGESMES